jgi:hypothetical protein
METDRGWRGTTHTSLLVPTLRLVLSCVGQHVTSTAYRAGTEQCPDASVTSALDNRTARHACRGPRILVQAAPARARSPCPTVTTRQRTHEPNTHACPADPVGCAGEGETCGRRRPAGAKQRARGWLPAASHCWPLHSRAPAGRYEHCDDGRLEEHGGVTKGDALVT